MHKVRTIFILFILTTVISCSSTIHQPIKPSTPQNKKQRTSLLTQLSSWQLVGKIAFLEKNKKQSATINWQVSEQNQTQKLTLSTFLGITLLSLESHQGQHQLIVNGKNYQTQNLTQLIEQLAHLTVPIEALSWWIRGLPSDSKQHVIYNKLTLLPKSINGFYHQRQWNVNFQTFKPYQIESSNQQVFLPEKLTLTTDELMIKIKISSWKIYLSKQKNR